MTASKELWRSQGYLAWFTADTAVAVGTALRGFAIPLIAFSVSHSLATAGWLATMSAVLQQGCTLLGGTIVDRHPRKPLIIANAVIQTLLWTMVSALMISGRLNITVLFAVVGVAACTTGLIGEATDAALRSIIDMQEYSKARSINEGRDATINMAGSPIGGILYGIQPWLPFVCSALVYAIAGGSATRLHLRKRGMPMDTDAGAGAGADMGSGDRATGASEAGHRISDVVHAAGIDGSDSESSGIGAAGIATVGIDAAEISASEIAVSEIQQASSSNGSAQREGHDEARTSFTSTSFLSDFVLGWQWTFHTYRLPLIIVAASLINFGLNGLQYTIQLHLINVGTEPFRIGLMDTGVCIGILVGSILANRLSDKVHVGKMMCAAFIMAFVFVIPMLVDSNYWVILICYAFVALPFPMVNSMLFGFVFSKTDENLQGRVATVISVPAQVLSMFCGGIAGSLLPLTGFTVSMSIFWGAIGISMLIATLSPAIRTIPKSDEWATARL
ncbi:MFS transporter [Bifidobacterium crudilactis]|uniref:MFS transporter n=1 Tax=Bifidobacterium crudilactis TaxID=327277 RepID=UPI00235289DB|nr:MFS transporter [Bifidobacterium crudilactis]